MPEDRVPRPLKRKELAKKNRQAMIDATLSSVAELGVAQTSVTEIVNRAGLSRGMIHLHFGGKENLLVAAAKQSAERYFDVLDKFLEAAGAKPQEIVAAVVNADLDERVMNPGSVKIWYAFRGAARDRAMIAQFSDTRDARLNNLIYRAFREICDQSQIPDSSTVARDATHGTLALLEGMWTDYLLHPDLFDRQIARRIVFRFLSGILPDHFELPR